MANIAVFVERYTVNRSEEMAALMRFSHAAQKLGHRLDVLFRTDIYKIPQYDALFIRSLTDPMNSAYVAARIAEMHGLPVIDDPDSIIICCDKVNMYRRLQLAGVAIPETTFVNKSGISHEQGAAFLEQLGEPFVLKAPNSSFSLFVEKIHTPEEFVKVGKRFVRRSDRLIAQKFVKSEFDWRVGVLAGEPLYVCQYIIPKRRWKILTYTEGGRVIEGDVKGFRLDEVDAGLLETAVSAANAVGNGLYGIDIKQVGDQFVVIEVNDNPTIAAGEEDAKAPKIYEKILEHLVNHRD